jgi:hypothetical protein
MLFDVQHNIKIASRTTVHSPFAIPCETDTRSIFHASGDFGVDRFLTQHAAFTFALGARIGDDRASSLTGRTSASDTEESLLITNLTLPIARTASDWCFSRSRARSMTLFASFMAADGNRRLRPEHSLFKLQVDVLAQIGAALCTTTPTCSATSTKEIAEAKKISEDIA